MARSTHAGVLLARRRGEIAWGSGKERAGEGKGRGGNGTGGLLQLRGWDRTLLGEVGGLDSRVSLGVVWGRGGSRGGPYGGTVLLPAGVHVRPCMR